MAASSGTALGVLTILSCAGFGAVGIVAGKVISALTLTSGSADSNRLPGCAVPERYVWWSYACRWGFRYIAGDGHDWNVHVFHGSSFFSRSSCGWRFGWGDGEVQTMKTWIGYQMKHLYRFS